MKADIATSQSCSNKKQHINATFSYFPMQCFTPKRGFKEGNSERKYALTFIREVKSKSFGFHSFSRNSKSDLAYNRFQKVKVKRE